MNNEKLTNLKSFSDSVSNAEAESQFTEKEMQGYFDKKRKHRYADKLDRGFNVRKKGAGLGPAATASNKTSGNSSSATLRYLLIALLAGLVAFAAYFFLIRDNSPAEPKVMMAYATELYTPVDANIRGAQSEQQQLANALYKAYESKDFAKVVAQHQELTSSTAAYDLTIEQVAGIAHASLGNHKQAIEIFNGILATPESSFSNHATVRYLLGLVHLLNDDKENARKVFETVKPGDYNYEAAQAKLMEIANAN